MKLIIIILLFTAVGVCQSTDTLTIRLDFSERMNINSIFDPNNYHITDSLSNRVEIYRVGITSDYKSVVLFIKNPRKTGLYNILIFNVADSSGNLIEPFKNQRKIYIQN